MKLLLSKLCVRSRYLKYGLCQYSKYSTTVSQGNHGFDFEGVFRTKKVPEYFNFATDVFDAHVTANPSNLALWIENDAHSKQWSFTQLRAESVRASISMRKLLAPNSDPSRNTKSIPTDTSLFILLPRVPEWWFIYLASIRIGTIFCPATVQLSPEDIAYRLRVSRAKIVMTDDEDMWKVEEAQRLEKFPTPIKIVVPRKRNLKMSSDRWLRYDELVEDITDSDVLSFRNAETKSDAHAQAFFTSGTTGKPKMVIHTHSSYGVGHYKTSKMMTIKENDLFWNIADPGWAKSSYGNFFAPWIAGAGVYIHQMERFEVPKVLEILRTRPINGFCAPPTLFRAIVQENDKKLFNCKALEYCVTGGESMSDATIQAWNDRVDGVNILPLYGQTETTSAVGYTAGVNRKENSIGLAHLGYDVRITDDDGNEVPRGAEGNIAIRVKPERPIGLFKGYAEEGVNGMQMIENHKSMVGDFYLTGDLGYQDEEGHFYFAGRADDVIISAGYRIGPTEVESVLQSHPSVAECAVVSSQQELRGAVVKAFIVLSKEFKNHDHIELTKTLQDYCKEHTAPYKYPRRIEFVETLPKTISGKIIRRELRLREHAKV